MIVNSRVDTQEQESFARTVKVDVVAAVGTPDITPEGERASPGGNEPETNCQE